MPSFVNGPTRLFGAARAQRNLLCGAKVLAIEATKHRALRPHGRTPSPGPVDHAETDGAVTDRTLR